MVAPTVRMSTAVALGAIFHFGGDGFGEVDGRQAALHAKAVMMGQAACSALSRSLSNAPDFRRVGRQVFLNDGGDCRAGGRRGERRAAEGGAVVAVLEGVGRSRFREHNTDGHAAAQRLRQRENIRLNGNVLVGKEFPGASQSGLHFIEDEQRAARIAEPAHAGHVLPASRDRHHFLPVPVPVSPRRCVR